MSSSKAGITRFFRFCTVGCVNTGVDFSVFFLLNLTGMPYLLAQVLSYSTGVANSYVLNRKWTFSLAGKINAGEVLKFIIVNSISLLVSSTLLYLMHDIDHAGLWLAKAVATLGGIAVNYTGSRTWVFSGNQTDWAETVGRLFERIR